MKNLAFAAAAAFMLAGIPGVAMAQGPDHNRMGPPQFTAEARAALVDAKMAAIKAGLKLSDAQQVLWEPVERELRKQSERRAEVMKEIEARFKEAREKIAEGGKDKRKRPDFLEALERRAEFAASHAESAKALLDAVKPLWATMTDEQKTLFPILMHFGDMPEAGKNPGKHAKK
jgi:Domain of Unknown Function (DUF1520).